MKTVLTIVILLFAVPALAQVSQIRIFWEYDHQNVPEYAIDTVTVEVNGEQMCSDDSPIIDTGTGMWYYSCPWNSFVPGTHQVRLIFTDRSGFNTYTNYEEITIPEEIPDRIDPRITGHEVVTSAQSTRVDVTFLYYADDVIHDATDFNLYADEVLFCSVDRNQVEAISGNRYSMSCRGMLSPGEVSFMMTAIYASGDESPFSRPEVVIKDTDS